MANDRPFFDTNVLLYLFSGDTSKADAAESVMVQGGTISVQVLNEFTSVAQRKMGMSIPEIRAVLGPIRDVSSVVPLHEETHDDALRIADRYGYSFWDALILASALEAGCSILYTEDMQAGQLVEQSLRIINPFLDGAENPS